MLRHLKPLGWSLLALLVIGLPLAWLVDHGPLDPLEASSAAHAQHEVAQGSSPCTITGTKTAAPDILLLGEEVTLTLTARAQCPAPPVHLVLVYDGSAAMEGDFRMELIRATRELIEAMDMPNHPERQIALVSFNDEADTICQLTNRESIIRRCVDRLPAEGGRDIGAGIEEGRRALVLGRPEVPDAEELMIVVAAGPDDMGCGNATSAATRAESQNITIGTVCLGPDCDEQCMRSIASDLLLAFDADFAGELRSDLPDLLERMLPDIGEIAGATIVDRLSPDVLLVPGSVVPPADDTSADGHRLTWNVASEILDGVTVTLRVTPTQVGTVTLNVGASLIITDTEDRTAQLDYPDVDVLVLAPMPVATATSTPIHTDTPTATATADPSASATASSDPSASETPSPDPSASTTPSPDPSASATPTPDPSASATPTPDPSASATATPDPSASATPTPDPSASATPSPLPTTPPPSSTPDPNASLTPTPLPSNTPDPAASPTPTEFIATPFPITGRIFLPLVLDQHDLRDGP